MPISIKVRTVALALAATLVLYLVYQFVSLRSQNYLTSVPRSDCIVILGAAVWPGGQPSIVLGDRISRAAELYRQGAADKIICSGGVGTYPPAEAEVCRESLVKAGVPGQAVVMELKSTSTSEQATLIKEICDREGFKSIALVTSFYHERRATQLFRSAGFRSIADARCTHDWVADLDFRTGREAVALAVMNWWQWAAAGLTIGGLTLWYRAVRRRKRQRT